MYLDYWGLSKHPFNNVPDPDMYFEMHQSVDDAVSEILFAVEEGDEALAVVIGPLGAGKTMSLRIVLDSIEKSSYRIAFVTNPDMTFPQLLREIIGQLQGKACEEKKKDVLLEKFNNLLFETDDESRRVIIFIDEGNIIKPHNLESLRLLTNMQDDSQNLFTIVLAGQPELGRRLEDPRRANLFQRIGVYSRIQGIDSKETMKGYIEHRLARSGMTPDRVIFTENAIDSLWKHSDGGMPRIINKLCKLSMKAAEAKQLTDINDEIIESINSRIARSPAKKSPQEQKPVVQPLENQPVTERGVKGRVPEQEQEPEPPSPENPQAATVHTEVTEIAPKEENGNEKKRRPPETEEIRENNYADLSDEEIEELASRLATERIKSRKQLADPFEAWENARADILKQMKRNSTDEAKE